MKKIILDTDLGSDVDDVGALALANILHKRGIVELLAVTHTTSSPYGPLICEAINEHYGNGNVPVGVYKGPSFLETEDPLSFPKLTAEHFPHRSGNVSVMEDAVTTLRRTLAKHSHVTLIGIGPLRNIADLLRSEPDEYSPLNGMELFHESVDEVYLMGGKFPDVTGLPSDLDPEYNLFIALDDARFVLSNMKVKTTFVDSTLGLAVRTGALVSRERDDSDIVSFAYRHYRYREKDNSRFSWDPITVYHACVRDDYFTDIGPGTVLLDENGRTSFREDRTGNSFITVFRKTPDEVKERLEHLLLEE